MTTPGTKRGKYRRWTKADHNRLIAFVRKNVEQFSIIAHELGRTVEAVRNRLQRHGPPDVRNVKRQVRFCPDLTPAQIAYAKRVRESGHRGVMDLRKIAKIMGVRLVQIQRVFAPHEIERKKYAKLQAAGNVNGQPITVPQEVIIERDYAMSRDRFCAAELLGDPPPHRSALGRKQAGLPV